MKALVLCGGLPQIALIKELKSRSITTILADMNEKVAARAYADAFYPVSALDVQAVKALAVKERVDCVFSVCADQVLQVAAQVNEELGLPWYIDFATAENVSKKSYMKRIFKQHGVPTTDFEVMATLEEAKIAHLRYPLIVKPVDAYSSRGVCKVYTPDELNTAFDNAVAISRTKTAIVEEFAEGDEVTVDVYVEGGKAHVLCLSTLYKIGEDGKFIINRSRIPADISADVAAAIGDAAQQIATAFGLTDTPMLVQLITDGKRISVVEFCARTGGGIKFRMIEKFSGFDVVKAVVDLALGDKPHVGELPPIENITVNEFVYCRPGVLHHVEGFEELLAEGVITEYAVFKAPGVQFGAINGSGDRVAYFSIEAETEAEVKRRHAIANARIKALTADGEDMIRHDLLEKFSGDR